MQYVENPYKIDVDELSRNLVEEPHWLGDSAVLRKAKEDFRKIAGRFNECLMEKYGKIFTFRDLKIRQMPPTYVVENGYVRKILGLYNPENNEIALSSDLPPYLVDRVLAHELAHYVQHKTGVIEKLASKYGRNARERIESHAENLVSECFACYRN